MKPLFISLFFIFIFLPSMHAQEVDRSVAPVNTSSFPTINFDKFEQFNLPNGLTVMLVQNHKLPVVEFTLWFDKSPLGEKNKKGYISVFGEMLQSGTTSRTKAEINEATDLLAADLSFGATRGGFSVLKKNYEKTFEIFSDIILHPIFTEEELSLLKTQLISSYEASKKSQDAITSRVTSILLYGKEHPYGEYMDDKTIDNIGREDFVKLWENYYKPNNAILTVTGDISREEAEEMVIKYLGGWKSGDIPTTPDAPEVKNPDKTEINFIVDENADQCFINVTQIQKLSMKNDNFFAAKLGQMILGVGGFSGRLMQNIREDKGWTYGAYASMGQMSKTGIPSTLSARAKVRHEVVDSAVVEFMKEIKRIHSEEPTEKEARVMKTLQTGRMAIRLEDPTQLMIMKIRELYYNVPNFYTDYVSSLEAVDVKDIPQAMQYYISPSHMRIVISGRSEVIDKLSKLGYEVKKYDSLGNEINE